MGADDFTAALLAEVKADLDAKVTDRDITQAQADRAYERTERNIDRIVNYVPDEDGRRPCRALQDRPANDATPPEGTG